MENIANDTNLDFQAIGFRNKKLHERNQDFKKLFNKFFYIRSPR